MIINYLLKFISVENKAARDKCWIENKTKTSGDN